MINIINKYLNQVEKSQKIVDLILNTIKENIIKQMSMLNEQSKKYSHTHSFCIQINLKDLGLSESDQEFILSNIFTRILFNRDIKLYEIIIDNINYILFIDNIQRRYTNDLKKCISIRIDTILYEKPQFERLCQRYNYNVPIKII